MKNRMNEKGAVSLFVVVFAMLIITVITVSFVRLVMVDQQQASDNDLSQSAYDSAQAGVEDAKRALLRYQQICSTTATPAECAALRDRIATNQCNAVVAEGGVAVPEAGEGGNFGEVRVQQNEGVDASLNQAYTCVTAELETLDYVGRLAPGESKLVPLVSAEPFSTVTVYWFDSRDVTDGTGSVTLPPLAASQPLPRQSDWASNTPSLMRAQLIQFGESFTLEEFDTVGSVAGVTESNANAAFLYPTSGAGATTAEFTALDLRKTSLDGDPAQDSSLATPHRVQCQNNVNGGEYACAMSLVLPTPRGGGSDRTAFLRLTPFYNSTHFRVVLSNGDVSNTANQVRFQDVQPMIDSTGRANDLFRRVQVRVDLYNTDFPYPDATIDITGNLCKNFAVADTEQIYNDTIGRCTP